MTGPADPLYHDVNSAKGRPIKFVPGGEAGQHNATFVCALIKTITTNQPTNQTNTVTNEQPNKKVETWIKIPISSGNPNAQLTYSDPIVSHFTERDIIRDTGKNDECVLKNCVSYTYSTGKCRKTGT